MESLSSPPGYGGRYRTMDQAFYILNRVRDPWGDYGDMLTHGMAGRAGDGVLELERTGPFIPPISQPGMPGIVVTDEFRIRVEESSLTGIAFQPVRKTRIVNVPWHDGSRVQVPHYTIPKVESRKTISCGCPIIVPSVNRSERCGNWSPGMFALQPGQRASLVEAMTLHL